MANAIVLASASKSSKTETPPTTSSKAEKTSSPVAVVAKSSKAVLSLPTSSKSDKSAGSTKSSKSSSETYYLSPFTCPCHCITAENFELSDHLLEDAVTTCDATNDYQTWKVHDNGTFLKFESAAQFDEGMCLSVVHSTPPDDDFRRFLAEGDDDLCSGKLGLVRCTHSSTDWYFTGDQLLSATCWSKGISAAMTVDEECTDLTVSSESSTFMALDLDFISGLQCPAPTPSPVASSDDTVPTDDLVPTDDA